MPYIEERHRQKFDPLIDRLSEEIVSETAEDKLALAGFLNYVCTRTILKVVKLRFGKMQYWILAIITGVLVNILLEIYRRIGIPYEEQKTRENGDMDMFKEFTQEGE
ncbi:MAG: hypothetical protein A3I26_00065 [Candidatus Yanofskybacteria bacterium RIFCSPLOWO2_02_FULL_43_10]|uniref:Uncharacterized protein n=1 Tax=Candidatus Yanofskybacteria bacterium RIFCSPLOWO2_12_FULL_43_11b TaxID=1802710 RepID=A0A1F8H8B8_9BACT|nr:MAG: hypothetical protein A2742_03430 [Candidatus Yanofskybacteria bacterium RIFCSPHIGHO2_01_FULL_43_32]OGN12137.1 MAG: hypothetical protein A3C69_02205 [Candidatus Yanofskybacteria bacterium RIFCSPHIGHO2_02_FULL_43_12]OGN18253.1 MAG: hypothetical protein A3E34_02490 [Candidatus Yanofskybacteria bacterium RIFCSPHIGHO2_12_FULL_43_11]OGN25214.1 MAG: hypothetical protein A2923_00555 [Candidatus Yanofskybacteria bacterium RIFCSPLOWO2_01_FULL_43_46]OGN29270.1 MAG: hypothetical protein A3I26_00065